MVVPRRSAEPKPCDLCWLRLSAAISVYARPRSGLNAPRSMRSDFAIFGSFGSNGWNDDENLFQKIRFGCHGATYFNCSGNFVGSPASLNASTARIADAV